jgi:hypothetical protein
MKILSFDVGIINLAYCIFDTNTCKITNWEVVNLENNNNYNKIYINLIKQLDLRPHLLNDINIVIIEKQPSFNPKMRIIAGCLQTYFIIRGIVDKPESPIKSVDFFNPKHKLKCYSGPELELDSDVKSKYSRTKKLGVIICRLKLKEYSESDENIRLFENSKKKDDLSDCYLQAVTYSLFEKLISGKASFKVVQPRVVAKITKKQIISKVKELLSEASELNTTFFNETFPIELRNNIQTKYLLSFPMDNDTITTLLSSMNLKSFIKKIK